MFDLEYLSADDIIFIAYWHMSNSFCMDYRFRNRILATYEKHEYECYSCAKKFRESHKNCQFRDISLRFSISLSHIMNVLITATENHQIAREVNKVFTLVYPDLCNAIERDSPARFDRASQGIYEGVKTADVDTIAAVCRLYYQYSGGDTTHPNLKGYQAFDNSWYEEWIRSTFIIEEKRFDEDCSEFFQNSPIAKIARGKHFLLEYSMLDERGDEEKGNYFYDRSIHDYMCKKIESANAGSDTDSELLRRFNILYKIIEDVGSYSMNPNLINAIDSYTFNKHMEKRIEDIAHMNIAYSCPKGDKEFQLYDFWYIVTKMVASFEAAIEDNQKYCEVTDDQLIILDKKYHEIELKKSENLLEAANAQIEALQSKLENADSEKKLAVEKETEKLSSENRYLKNEIVKLQLLLDEAHSHDQELFALRNYAFEQAANYVEQPNLDETIESVFSGKKVIVIGGHENWQKKMRSKHPSLQIISGTNKNVPAELLANVDFAFLVTSHMSHAVYDNVIRIFQKDKIPFAYIGKISLNYAEAEMIQTYKNSTSGH